MSSIDGVGLRPNVSRFDFTEDQETRLEMVLQEAREKQTPPSPELYRSLALREATNPKSVFESDDLGILRGVLTGDFDFTEDQETRVQEIVEEARRNQIHPLSANLLHTYALRAASFSKEFTPSDLGRLRAALVRAAYRVN